MIIIGIAGRAKSGKDEICKALGILFRVRRVAFADPLKQELAEACDMPLHQLDQEKDRFRLGMQWWGTEFRRGEDALYWVKKAFTEIGAQQTCDNPPDVVVLPDVRFPNEADMIRQMGGVLWKVERPVSWLQRLRDWWNTRGDGHASETSLDGFRFDAVIKNDKTLLTLRRRVILAWYETVHFDNRPTPDDKKLDEYFSTTETCPAV